MKIRIWLTRILLPLIKLVHFIGKPEPKCTNGDLFEIALRIRPGDVLLSREDWRMSNILISGEWSHAAIMLGDLVLEAVPPRVRKVSLSQFVLSKDHIALLRPRFEIDFKDYSGEYFDDEYDFEFLSGNETFYCSELVYSYLKKCNEKMPFIPRITWGVETIVPDDFYKATDKFEVIYAQSR